MIYASKREVMDRFLKIESAIVELVKRVEKLERGPNIMCDTPIKGAFLNESTNKSI